MSSSLSLLLLAVVALGVSGYDTGHHYDLTRDVMLEKGFNPNTIEMVQLMNWMTDMNAQGIDLFNIPDFKEIKRMTNDLHFDGLYNSEQVDLYFITLMNNIHATVKSVINKKAGFKLDAADKSGAIVADVNFQLCFVMGMSLHVLQDFYTHTNFIDAIGHPAGGEGKCHYYAEVYVPKGKCPVDSKVKLMSGFSGAMGESFKKNDAAYDALKAKFGELRPHGSYDDTWNYKNLPGMNKDSPSRPEFDKGYVHAWAQTHAFVDTFMGWVEELGGVWTSDALRKYDFVTGFSSILGVDREEAARQVQLVHEGRALAFTVSAFVCPGDKSPTSKVDGHWKGKGSGSVLRFAAAAGSMQTGWLSGDYIRSAALQRFLYGTNVLKSLSEGLDEKTIQSNSMESYEKVVAFNPATLGVRGISKGYAAANDYTAVYIKMVKVETKYMLKPLIGVQWFLWVDGRLYLGAPEITASKVSQNTYDDSVLENWEQLAFAKTGAKTATVDLVLGSYFQAEANRYVDFQETTAFAAEGKQRLAKAAPLVNQELAAIHWSDIGAAVPLSFKVDLATGALLTDSAGGKMVPSGKYKGENMYTIKTKHGEIQLVVAVRKVCRKDGGSAAASSTAARFLLKTGSSKKGRGNQRRLEALKTEIDTYLAQIQ